MPGVRRLHVRRFRQSMSLANTPRFRCGATMSRLVRKDVQWMAAMLTQLLATVYARCGKGAYDVIRVTVFFYSGAHWRNYIARTARGMLSSVTCRYLGTL